MRRFDLLMLDAGLMCLATLIAFALRENFEGSLDRFFQAIPFTSATAVASIIVFGAVGTNRAVWRFANLVDYLRVAKAVVLVSFGAVSITFVYDRLDGLARSLPVLQALAGVALLVSARVLHRVSHERHRQRRASPAFLELAKVEPQANVLVVGITKVAETYLQAAAEFVPGRIKIAGLVGNTGRHVGRFVASCPVLGVPEDIENILDRLDVHGVSIDRIVVATSFQALRESQRDALLRVERSRAIALHFLAEDLGFDGGGEPSSSNAADGRNNVSPDLCFEIAPSELREIARRRYWMAKRAIDCLAAATVLVICWPLMAITAVFVAATMGSPVLFWQQRPGLGGRPIKLYKFRTMRTAHGTHGRRLSDAERVSRIGTIMRRLRLDELPQLLNVVRGEMAIIGPRPLLPCDQSDKYRARLLVRPGLTGWAQVVGGRDISPEDKAALDIWYVRNASFALDLEIAARTIPMVFLGERISRPLINRAWQELSEGGVLKGDLALRIENRWDMHSIAAPQS